MQFCGKVDRESHEGGILISFTGEAPDLGAALETTEGLYLGRVDTVIGRVDCALVHILPKAKELDVSSIGDSEIKIQQRRYREEKRGNNQRHRGQDRRGGYRNSQRKDSDRGGNDWDCPKCHNNNFAWRDTCNRCPTKRPKNASSGNGGGYQRRDNRRGGGGGGYQRGDNRGGNRRGGGGGGYQRSDNRGGNRRGGGGGRDKRGGDRRVGANRRGGDKGGKTRHWGNRDGAKRNVGYHRKKKNPNNPFKKKRDN